MATKVEVRWIGNDPSPITLAREKIPGVECARAYCELEAGMQVSHFELSTRDEDSDMAGKIYEAIRLCIYLAKNYEVEGEILVNKTYLPSYLAGLHWWAQDSLKTIEKAVKGLKASRTVARNQAFKDIRKDLESTANSMRSWLQ